MNKQIAPAGFVLSFLAGAYYIFCAFWPVQALELIDMHDAILTEEIFMPMPLWEFIIGFLIVVPVTYLIGISLAWIYVKGREKIRKNV